MACGEGPLVEDHGHKLGHSLTRKWLVPSTWSYVAVASGLCAKGYGAPSRDAAAKPEAMAMSCVLKSVHEPAKYVWRLPWSVHTHGTTYRKCLYVWENADHQARSIT